MNEGEDFDDYELDPSIPAMQMFDPPYRKPIAVAGTPISMIPASEQKYRNFLDWWFTVGRLKPDDPQGWSSISGPWVMRGRVDAISDEEWNALPDSERSLIRSWAARLPIGCFYD
jgi:hypothetical protein